MKPRPSIQPQPVWTPKDAADTLAELVKHPGELGLPADVAPVVDINTGEVIA